MCGIFARVVALIGALAVAWRRATPDSPAPAIGGAPVIPKAMPRRAIPTLKTPTAKGWDKGHGPQAAPGLEVNAFAVGLEPPRGVQAGALPGFPDGMLIGQHGSWKCCTLSGCKVIFVPFADGKRSGPPREILSAFLAPEESVSYGRPVGVAIWRVTAA